MNNNGVNETVYSEMTKECQLKCVEDLMEDLDFVLNNHANILGEAETIYTCLSHFIEMIFNAVEDKTIALDIVNLALKATKERALK